MATEINYEPNPAHRPPRHYTMNVTTAGGSSSSSASGVLDDGVVDPVAAPTDPSVTNWYTNTMSGTAWIWPAGGLAWQQIV